MIILRGELGGGLSSLGNDKLEALVIPLVRGVRLVNGGSREVDGCVGVSDGPVVVFRPACKSFIILSCKSEDTFRKHAFISMKGISKRGPKIVYTSDVLYRSSVGCLLVI